MSASPWSSRFTRRPTGTARVLATDRVLAHPLTRSLRIHCHGSCVSTDIGAALHISTAKRAALHSEPTPIMQVMSNSLPSMSNSLPSSGYQPVTGGGQRTRRDSVADLLGTGDDAPFRRTLDAKRLVIGPQPVQAGARSPFFDAAGAFGWPPRERKFSHLAVRRSV